MFFLLICIVTSLNVTLADKNNYTFILTYSYWHSRSILSYIFILYEEFHFTKKMGF